MSASLALLAAALQQISVPLGPVPRQVERPIAPVETAGPAFARACKDFDEWDKPAPAVRIHGNTYLVGTCGIASILVTGGDGHVLIDSGTESGAEVVARNIRSLGFRLNDVKYLLHSHEHFDHVGGMARLQQLTGAQLVASPNAAAVFATGAPGPGDPQAGMHAPFRAARVDRIIQDGGTIRLGNLMLKALSTKGHTNGALTWTWVSCDGGVCPTIVYADSLTPVSRDDYRFIDHPSALEAFRASIQRVGALECDILLTPHPSSSDMIKRMAGKAPLIDARGCAEHAAALTKRLDERIATETAARK